MNDAGEGGGNIASAAPVELAAGASCIRAWTTGVRIRAGGLTASAPETTRANVLIAIAASLRATAERHDDIAALLDDCANAFLAADSGCDLDEAVAVALGEEGYTEKKANRTKYGAWFGGDGEPWCAKFVSWSFEQAGIALPKAQTAKGFAAVRQGWAYARNHDQLVWEPKPGDIFLLRTGVKGRGHTGIVVSVDTKTGEIHTIEGNTNATGAREGTAVLQKTRTIASINQGFWRPYGEISNDDRIPPKGTKVTWPVAASGKKPRKWSSTAR